MKKNYGMVALLALSLTMSACYNDDDLWNKVEELETKIESNASDIATLSALVDALNQGKIIVKTEQTEEGYILTFNDDSKVEIRHGQDGKDGADGKDGTDGKDGENGENANSCFQSVEETDDTVIIILADGRVITLPKVKENLRILTFEDADAKFTPYILDYADAEINTWSDLIDDPQYSGPLTYGTGMNDAEYTWYDEGNTELMHKFPDNWGYCYWGGGHAISNYWGAGYTNEDRNTHIAKYYGEDYVNQWAGNDQMLGWFNLQFMTPIKPHSGNNFAVHYGYKDFFSYVENLPELSFADGVARVIDHMYVTNTNYTLNQLVCGVSSEAGNTFGGNWTGLNDDAWLKIVAYGFASIDDDEHTTEAEFYLVNGQNVVEDWQKWDLSGLGKVAKVQFNFLYSEAMGGSYGFTIPGYFAYDDIAVHFE